LLSRYWHTLRHLRPVQFYGRLWFRLYRPRPDLRPAPGVRPVEGNWVPPPPRPASLLGPSTLRFLNATHELTTNSDPWNDPARDKLWLYNLHYFDDLNAAGQEQRRPWHLNLLQRWVAENPPGHGNGWEPYPTSLRLVNWLKWALASAPLPPACQHSLAVQARWLRRRLEHHLLGNHLLANAKALVFAGAWFDGPEADRWRSRGLRLLARELDEQILPDGGHFERSPMYHALLLEDVLDLINLAGAYPGLFVVAGDAVAHWCATAAAMRRWLAAMTHPDGEISFFNDAAMGIAPTLEELAAYGERLSLAGWSLKLPSPTAVTMPSPSGLTRPGPGDAGHPAVGMPPPPTSGHSGSPTHATRLGLPQAPIWLRDSGYLRLEAGPAVAILDVAPIGPDYLPGHAHADTLSFELSLWGQRVIVNGGTARYGSGHERLAERGTAAHSTVQIDGADSSEVWGGFRVARRARPFDVRIRALVGQLNEVSAAHDGYRRLPGQPVHRRAWRLTAGQLAVIDTLEGRFDEAVARFHLHPAIRSDNPEAGEGDAPFNRQAGHILLPDGQRVTWRVTSGVARLVPDHWRPQFGLSLPAHCLEVRFTNDQCRLTLTWGEWEREGRRSDLEG
jgi:uncharacterized heparinase superfamily protein